MVRKLLPLLAGVVAIGIAPAHAGPSRSAEEQLQHELRGRVAGEPVDCVNLRHIRSSRVIDRTAIVFDAGGTLYVNRPRAGAETLRRWDAQVVRPFGWRLCSIDVINMVDSSSGIPSGTVFLGDFVPYRRVRD